MKSKQQVVGRHFIIPDTQVRPGVPLDHLDWVAQELVHVKPTSVIHLGDHWDMPSMSSYDVAGSSRMEGARYEDDIGVANEAFKRLVLPMEEEQKRLKRGKRAQWEPRKVFLFGNHENRVARALSTTPKFLGVIGEHQMLTRDFERYGFLERVWEHGVLYSHFFQNSHSSHAIGGTIDNRLNKIGASFVQGHEQGFRYGTRIQASGATWHGLVAGSCYLHDEDYRGAQGQGHWRGVVVLNEVRNGDYCVMPLTLDYLCRKYEGKPLSEFLRKKYKSKDLFLAREEN